MELSIIEWCGRLGNNLIQLCNLLLFCKKFKIKCIQNLEHPIIGMFTIDFREQENIDNDYSYLNYIYIITNKNYNNLGYQFYDSEDCPNFCKAFYPYKITSNEIRNIYLEYIYPNLKINKDLPRLNEDTLVLHIRSGDEILRIGFSEEHNSIIVKNNIDSYLDGNNNVIYALPPKKAYERIISHFKKVIIVAEDRLNPAINYLAEKYPEKVVIHTKSLLEDISLILSSQNFACSSIYNGTFGQILSYLSINLKNIYLFECMPRDYLNEYKYIDKNLKIILIHNYYTNYSIKNILLWDGDIDLIHCT